MKKLMFLATAAIAVVACSKTYEAEPTGDLAIGFGSWAETMTKAEARVQGTNDFLAGDTFAVYGYKDKSTPSPATVFDGVVVTASGNPVTWDYENHRFWDSAYDSYTFFAVSPSAIGTGSTSHNAQTGAITTASLTFDGDNNDILIADKKVVAKGDAPYFTNFGKVLLNFRHVASLVDVKVKKAPSLHDATVTVSALALEKIVNQGVLTVTADKYVPAITLAASDWSNAASTTSYGPGDGVNDDTDISSPIAVAEDTAFETGTHHDPAASTFFIKNLVVKPQSFGASGNENSQKLTLTYKIAVTGSADIDKTETVYLADFDLTNQGTNEATYVGSFEPGKHYTLYLTIDAHVITFNAQVQNWTDVKGYNYLVL